MRGGERNFLINFRSHSIGAQKAFKSIFHLSPPRDWGFLFARRFLLKIAENAAKAVRREQIETKPNRFIGRFCRFRLGNLRCGRRCCVQGKSFSLCRRLRDAAWFGWFLRDFPHAMDGNSTWLGCLITWTRATFELKKLIKLSLNDRRLRISISNL